MRITHLTSTPHAHASPMMVCLISKCCNIFSIAVFLWGNVNILIKNIKEPDKVESHNIEAITAHAQNEHICKEAVKHVTDIRDGVGRGWSGGRYWG